MTLIQASEALGVSVSTLRAQIKLGVLRAQKVGRDWHVSSSEVTRYRIEHRRGMGNTVETIAERNAFQEFRPVPKPGKGK